MNSGDLTGDGPTHGAPSDNTTILEELERFRAEGYVEDFLVRPGALLQCRRCQHTTAAGALELDALRRLEGASDPDDMSAVLALECQDCGAKGTALVAYGPTATEDEDELLRQLPDVDRTDGTRARGDE